MRFTPWSRPVLYIAAAAIVLLDPVAAAAQTVSSPGTPPSQVRQQIDGARLQRQLIEEMHAQGMTPEQIRRDLARRGYPSNLLDPYIDEDVTRPADPNARVLAAAEALGLLRPAADTLEDRPRRELELRDRGGFMPAPIAIERERGLRIFGLDVFARPTTEFQPQATGPVPSNYTLGPGDELVLVLTGDVEQSHTLPVSREGSIIIPNVGQIWVNGLTLAELRNQLYTHLGRAYSGVRRGPQASTQFQVTLGELRPNQIFASGQVNRPGVVMVNAVASALNALYEAGGPAPTGSFRDVRIMRGNRVVERVDLYLYLLRGDNLSATRLEPGDVLFVPTTHAHISVHGQVVRPAIYEIRPGETILDVLAFAGGLNAPAHMRRARIERILPPEDRTVPGVDRVVLDVDLTEAARNPAAAPEIRPGDAIEIFPVRAELRQTVSIDGGVWHPGSFRYTPGMRAWDLVEQAEGLRADAYRDRAQIVRVDPQDSTMSITSFSLRRGEDGLPLENPQLREFDTVRVFSERDFTTRFPLTISGFVRGPAMRDTVAVRDTMGVRNNVAVRNNVDARGTAREDIEDGLGRTGPGELRPTSVTVDFQEGMTLRDLVLQAGGLSPAADLTIEVARLADPTRLDTHQIAQIIHLQADASFFVSEQDRRRYLGPPPSVRGSASDFVLQPYDRVTVRSLPELEFQRAVTVTGEVRHAGSYSLQRRDERLIDLLERAGGLTATAFANGGRLYRGGTLVNVDLPEALRRPNGPANVVLMPGDSLDVPEYNPVVLVQGAVNSPEPVAVLYRQGASLSYYIENAGGYARYADRRGVNVRHANGSGEAVTRTGGIRREPRPTPGSVVTVPAIRDEDRFDVVGLFGNMAQIAAALTTVLLLIQRF
jgi:polysaccharide biosynthesis/export protein